MCSGWKYMSFPPLAPVLSGEMGFKLWQCAENKKSRPCWNMDGQQ
jgi:hypothetical protein